MSLHETLPALLAYTLQGGLLLTVGLVTPRLLRLRHPTTLLVYWRVLLPLVVVLPLVTAAWQPRNPLPLLSIDGTVVEEVVTTALGPDVAGFRWEFLIVPALVVTAIALARLVLGLVYLGRCRREAAPIVPLPERITALQHRLGLEVPFAATEHLSVPFTFGWARPIVMVPISFKGLSVDEQEGVACHELLHVHRRDWPVALAEELVRAIFWFHPAVWIVLPRIALCREQVVDARTIAITGKRRQYLDALWRFVVSSREPAAAVAVPLIGTSHLRARVEHLKKESAMSKPRIIASVVVLFVSVAAAATVGATLFASTAAGAGRHAIGSPRSAGDEKPAENSNTDTTNDQQLETWDFDGECSELTHPKAIEKVQPVYPPEARESRITGSVVLRSTISDRGVVEDLEVLESPDELLTTAAVDAVRQWRFEPAQCDGEPVGVYYSLTVNFALK